MAKRTKTVIVNGDHRGDVGNVISGVSGDVHYGNGDVHTGDSTSDKRDRGGRTFTGNGAVVIEGDNHGGISRRW
jgi:hypothetical protein